MSAGKRVRAMQSAGRVCAGTVTGRLELHPLQKMQSFYTGCKCSAGEGETKVLEVPSYTAAVFVQFS